MAINPKDFIPRPGFVNKQGHLPDPVELCCIQVPKVFDQCLKKECLKPADDCEQLCKQIPDITDPSQIRCVGSYENLKVVVNSITKCPVVRQSDYKKVTINYTVTFDIDVEIEINGIKEIKTLSYSVNKTITTRKLYCPDSVAKTIIGNECTASEEMEQEFIKLEILADCLGTDISQVKCNNGCSCSCSVDPDQDGDKKVFLCVTLGLVIIIKCQIVVQLLIPAYGYCPIPREECECDEDPCREFMRRALPDLYPPQKMDDLFDDSDKDEYLEEERTSIDRDDDVDDSISLINKFGDML